MGELYRVGADCTATDMNIYEKVILVCLQGFSGSWTNFQKITYTSKALDFFV